MFEETVNGLTRVTGPDKGGWYTALCPFHDDHNPSLRLTERGFKCMSCGAHGSLIEFAKKTGPPTSTSDRRSFGSGVTLSDLARTKGLPIELLESLGWRSTRYFGRPAVAIPYWDEVGVTLREQLRLSLSPGEKVRFAWGKGQGIYPLGLDALVHARLAGWVLIEEGATDYAACFDGAIPAIGVPGANTWKSSWSSYLEGIENVFVWMEPGVGGRALVKAVSASRPDALIVIAPPESNDHCDLHQMHGEGFSDRLIDLLIAAELAETVATDTGAQQESARFGNDPICSRPGTWIR